MFSKKAFPFVMPFWISLFVVIIMCCVMSLVNAGGIHFPGIVRDILIGTVVAYIGSTALPVNKWSAQFAELCHAKPGTIAHTLLSNVVPTIVMGILMTLLFTYLAIGFAPYYLAACLSSLPLGLGIGYIAGLLATPVAMKLTALMCSKN